MKHFTNVSSHHGSMPVHGWSRMTCNAVYIKSFLRKLEAIHLNSIPEVHMNLKCSHSCQKFGWSK